MTARNKDLNKVNQKDQIKANLRYSISRYGDSAKQSMNKGVLAYRNSWQSNDCNRKIT